MSKTQPDFGPERVPCEKARGDTPEDAYLAIYDADVGDELKISVYGESSGQIEGCEDGPEEWVGTVEKIGYDGRGNKHIVSIRAERCSDGSSGRAAIKHHTNKANATEKGLGGFSDTSHGSPMEMGCHVSNGVFSIFEDDITRTVTHLERC